MPDKTAYVQRFLVQTFLIHDLVAQSLSSDHRHQRCSNSASKIPHTFPPRPASPSYMDGTSHAIVLVLICF